MKKILTLFSALLLTVSMWGAVDRTYNMTSITTNSVSIVRNVEKNGYTITCETEGKRNTSYYTYDLSLELVNATDFVGTFSVGASSNELSQTSHIDWYDSSNSTTTVRYPVNPVSATTTYPTSLTITHVSGNTYKISGNLYAAKSKTSDAPYLYNFSTNEITFTFDPYKDEPTTTSSFDFTPTYLELGSSANQTPIVLQLSDDFTGMLNLQFNVEDYAIPAGIYNVASTGVAGTIMASKGVVDPITTYVSYSSFKSYYITGGSVTVSYNQDKSKIILSGSLTSAKGSTITLADVTLDNPIKELDPKNVIVTNIEASTGNSWSAGDYFVLNCTSTPECALTLYVNDIMGKDFIVNDIGSNSYIGNKYVVVAQSSATITNTSGNNFLLNATLYDPTGQKYIITNAAFSCQLPTPWDSEPAKKEEGITLNISGMNKEFESGVLTLYMGNDDDYTIAIAFPATEDKLAAGTYDINDTEAEGTIIASPGMGDYYPAPSYLIMYEGWSSYNYFLRSGELTVGFSDDNRKMTITGTAYSFRETPITFNVEVGNPYYVGEETLEVTSITPTKGDGYITFGIDAKEDTGLLSGAALTVNTTELVGEFGNSQINFDEYSTWVGDNSAYTALDNTKANSIVVTQSGFEYTLAATVYGANGSTYMMEGSFVLAELNEEEDNSALLADAMGQTVDLDIKRTFASGMWQTICLPFNIADIDASPLTGATVKSVTSCSLDGETLLVEAVDVTSMTAGMPYLIKWEGSAPLDDSPTFSGVTIAAAEGITSGNFVANMSAKHYDDVTGKYIVVADNGLAPMGTEGSVKGFRAFFQLNVSAGVAPRKFAFATSVVTDNEQISKAVPVRKALVNGQLLIIKNNQVFNAQAQELK